MPWIVATIIAVMLAFGMPVAAGAETPMQKRAFDFDFVSIDGKPLPLKGFAGRVLLVVNTASFCGFTPQYKGLQALYETYEKKGLTVIGVPSNDFGAQEPKSEAEIKTFCQGAFGVTFPLTEKAVVKGDAAHPFYRWAARTLGAKSAPAWNFHKYLVGRTGWLIAGYGSRVTPESRELVSAIENELAKPAQADTN
ncbi:MAG: glutathione peroxidase [Hyphomicrobiaceae bacterium]